MDLSKLSFTSQYPIDKLATPQKITGTRNIPGNTAFSSFTVANPIGKAFIPFIRYSIDGGLSWRENGSPFRGPLPGFPVGDTVSMTCRCNNTTIQIYEINNLPTSQNTLWEITGVDINV